MSNGYDAWKLSNPWDDGHYNEGEEEKSPLDEPIFYEYLVGRTNRFDGRWVYGMMLTTGQQIEVWKFGAIPNIQTEWYEYEDMNKVIVKTEALDYFDYIDEQKFVREYTAAMKMINDTVRNEARI